MSDFSWSGLSSGGGGSTWYNGAGAPSAGLGSDGDYYLRTSNGDVYTKAAGAWSVTGNIKGATGAIGSLADLDTALGFTKPSPASFTLVGETGGDAAKYTSAGGYVGVRARTASANMSAIVASGFGSGKTAIIGIEYQIAGENAAAGIVLRDSSSGAMIFVGPNVRGGSSALLGFFRVTSGGAYSAAEQGSEVGALSNEGTGVAYFKVDDTVNRNWYLPDEPCSRLVVPSAWRLAATVGRTTFATCDQYGAGVWHTNSGGVGRSFCHIFHATVV